MRVRVTMACAECKQRNYNTVKNKKNDPDRLEMNKYCRFCKKHTAHKETKQKVEGSKMAEKQSNVAVAKKKLSPIRFFRESKAEFKKVVWPSKKQVINNTIVVILTMIVVGLFIWGLDAVLGFLVKSVLQNQQKYNHYGGI